MGEEELLSEIDDFAISWIKARRLERRVGGPVGKEFGGSECEYTEHQEEPDYNNIIKLVNDKKINIKYLKEILGVIQ